MISRPERDLGNTGVESSGLTLMASSLDFLGVAILPLLAGCDFGTVCGVSAEGLPGSAGSGNSGIVDGSVGIGTGLSSDKFPEYLTGIESWGRCCAMVAVRGLMSCLLRLSLLLLLLLMIQYESGVVSLDSMYPGFHSSELSSVNQMGWLGR